MSEFKCPMCEGDDLTPATVSHSGNCITSDFKVVEDIHTECFCCKSCGLVFEARGVREDVERFYEASYDLMTAKPNAGIQSFVGEKPVSQALRSLEIMNDMIELPQQGRMLEAGAGVGEFTGHFLSQFNDWEVHAFEPSKSFDNLKLDDRITHSARASFETFDADPGSYDLVVSLGVLEHVTNPADMLLWKAECLKLGGIAFIRVPNFANNPSDIFCADHLSKLTKDTVQSIAEWSGFELMDYKELGVPMFFAFQKIQERRPLRNVYDENMVVLKQNEALAVACLEAVEESRKIAKQRGGGAAIFGLAAAGLVAPFYLGFSDNEIACYVDDNSAHWGKVIHGSPVVGPEHMDDLNVKAVAITTSPQYWEKIAERLKPFDVEVISPKLQKI